MTDTEAAAPTFTFDLSATPQYEFHECSCPGCDCPQVTDNGGECLSCRTGHHEAEE